MSIIRWDNYAELPLGLQLEPASEPRYAPAPAAVRPDQGRYRARCEACGHNWRLNQHERILCPYCFNEPSDVAFKGSFVLLADEAAQRWFS